MNRTSLAGTVISAAAWAVLCGYLFFAWPSLVALLETLGFGSWAWIPSAAFPLFGWVAVLGLAFKNRWLRAPCALAVDAVVGAPALLAIAFLLEPFVVPIE